MLNSRSKALRFEYWRLEIGIPVPVIVCSVYINLSIEMPQNEKPLYIEKLVAYWLWEPVNPDATSVHQLGVDRSTVNMIIMKV